MRTKNRLSGERGSRRDLLKLAGAAMVAGALPAPGLARVKGAVVVVGGGFGGATCARYLRRLSSDLRVTLVERSAAFATCPFSNAVLGGLRDLDSITHGFDGLRRQGVTVVQGDAVAIEPERSRVRLADGESLSYDRLVLSPGIDFKWNAIENYGPEASERMPHAWKAGPQTALLRRQIESMEDGGVVAIAVPDNPFRCPPGPYERASLIANYLHRHKPRSKVLILDAKDSFSKAGLFRQGWEELYPGMIEWIGFSEGGNVVSVEPTDRILQTDFERFRADVANVVPPQRAGRLVDTAGLAAGGDWCPVNGRTFESQVVPGIHLLGDAILAGDMPKSGFSANNQAKVCARAVAGLLGGEDTPDPVLMNTCYSLLSEEYGISVAAVYRLNEQGEIASVPGAGGVSPADAGPEIRKAEAIYAQGWYAGITADMYN